MEIKEALVRFTREELSTLLVAATMGAARKQSARWTSIFTKVNQALKLMTPPADETAAEVLP